LLESFEIEELEKRYEMGWFSSVEVGAYVYTPNISYTTGGSWNWNPQYGVYYMRLYF
jgi:hypothetical protein